jgi:glycosyltransferase involved in cell wall biosynthesis
MSRSLSILQVITPRHYSGAERVVVWLAEALQQRGHRVQVACKANEGMMADLAAAGVPVQALGISGKGNLLAPLRLARYARQVGAEVIHTHLSTAALWGSVAGKLVHVPTVAEVHALNTPTCYRLADYIIGCSEGVRQHLLQRGVPPERVGVLHNGIPVSRFANLRPAAEVRAELKVAPLAPLLIMVAHLAPKKGQHHLLRVLPSLLVEFPDLVCALVGQGEQQTELQALAAELGVSSAVRFLGFRPDAVSLQAAADIAVLPSYNEGLTLSLIESSYLGLPAVASNLPGVNEVVIDGQTGLLFTPGDEAALTTHLLTLLRNPALRSSLGQAAHQHAATHFTAAAMAAAAEELYLNLLSSRS